MYAYIWYRGSVHMCIQESLSLSADSEITGDCKVIWSFFHPDKPPAKPGFSPSVWDIHISPLLTVEMKKPKH